jgi:hypothetical protein
MVVTESSAPTISLTDDELAAVAVDAGGMWRGALPTLATDDTADLEAGVTRGLRSLVARRLVSVGVAEGGTPGALEAVRNAAGSAPAVVVYAASAGSLVVPRGTVVSVFAVRDSADYLIDVCLPGGIHDLVVRPREQAQQLVTGMVAAAEDPSRDHGDRPTVVFLSTCSVEPIVVTVEPTHARWAILPADGSEPVELAECPGTLLATVLALP